jgi:hypothetical protein
VWRDPIDGARHSLIGLHQYYAHNCTHDVHGAGGEAQLGACRIEHEIQPKERDPEAASCRQFCHLTAHWISSHMQVESNQLVLKTDCGIFVDRQRNCCAAASLP